MDFAYGGNGSGDEHEGTSNNLQRDKKEYHRHSTQQIQQLEQAFKENPHPDENQRQQLSREIGLDPKQIKFWFQNKRTQIKALNERADNNALKVENEKIQFENLAIREALRNVTCPTCDGTSLGEQDRQKNLHKLRIENALLKKEHKRLSDLVSRVVGKPGTLGHLLSSSMASPSNLPEANFFGRGMGSVPFLDPVSLYQFRRIAEKEKSLLVETAAKATEEVIELLQVNEPIWIKSSTDGRYFLHRDSYRTLFPKTNHLKSSETLIESSKDSGIVAMSAMHLIEIFLDSMDGVFPTLVTKASTIETIDAGNFGGSLHLMHAKLHILSPLVAPREFIFLRYCRRLDSTTWVIVDMSCDCFHELQDSSSSCWRLPSGCIIQEMPNGKSKVTWMEHVEVEDKPLTDNLFKDLVRAGQAYGAKRWIATLQRMCERCAFSMGFMATPGHGLEGVISTPEGRRSLMKLSHRMVKNFCEILSTSEKQDFPHLSELQNNGFHVSVRMNNGPVQPNGVIACVANSLRLPISYENLFNFFKDEKRRHQWDVLSNESPVNEIAHVSTGSHSGNCISIIQPFVPNQKKMLILQETCIDSLGALVIYAPMDLPALSSAINGEDTTKIPILPSGFVISSDGQVGGGNMNGASTSTSASRPSSAASILTVAFQILMSSSTFSKQLDMETMSTVQSLMKSTIKKIKVSIGCPYLD